MGKSKVHYRASRRRVQICCRARTTDAFKLEDFTSGGGGGGGGGGCVEAVVEVVGVEVVVEVLVEVVVVRWWYPW